MVDNLYDEILHLKLLVEIDNLDFITLSPGMPEAVYIDYPYKLGNTQIPPMDLAKYRVGSWSHPSDSNWYTDNSTRRWTGE